MAFVVRVTELVKVGDVHAFKSFIAQSFSQLCARNARLHVRRTRNKKWSDDIKWASLPMPYSFPSYLEVWRVLD